MYRHFVDIAGYTFSLSTESPRLKEWIIRTFRPDGLTDVRNEDLCVNIIDDYGVPFEGFDVDITSDEQSVRYERSDYLIEVDRTYSQATISVYDSFALKHALMNLYSAFTVQRQSGLLIHSSCVVQEGNAFLFSGHSGAGKSTVARISVPRLLLSNEATIVRIHEFGVMAYNSFAFRSDPGIFMQGYCPLRAIHFLQQSTQIYRTKISVAEAMMQLMDKVFFWAHDPSETAKLAQMIKRVVEVVPSFNLYFRKNDEFWREIS